ncbi:MAG TPA: hypothetical protein V6C65_21595, partial [Allocoleopsis sp.]
MNGTALTITNAATLDLANSQLSALNIEGGLLNVDTSNTRIGINTTTPTATLDVNGEASISGTLSFRDGAGTITTTGMNTLSIGGSETGNIVIDSGSNTTTLSDASINLAGGTASRFVLTDASKNIIYSGLSSILSDTLTDETGSGLVVFGTSPTFTTSVITDSSSFDVFNTTATTINAFGAATTLSLGASSGTTTINNAVAINGNSTLGNAITDTITFTGRVAEDADLIPIGTTGTNDLGSLTLPWDNLFVNNLITPINQTGQNGYWQRNAGALVPNSITDDILLGATATSSARFGFLNVAGGTPTASISAGSGNIATYVGGNGVLGTTNAQTLTIGSATTGNIVVDAGSNEVKFMDSSLSFLSNAPVLDAVNGTLSLNTVSNSAITTGTGLTTLGGDLTINGTDITLANNSTVALGSSTTALNFGSNLLNLDTSNTRIGINTNAPTSTLDVDGSASVSGSLTFRAGSGSIQTTLYNPLTIGGDTTGNITLTPTNGVGGLVTVEGTMNLNPGFTYQINGLDVLSASALGTNVTASSLTSVGVITGGEWQATTIAIPYGGTNANTIGSAGTVAYSDGDSYSFTDVGSSGQCLTSTVAGSPVWSTCALGDATNWWKQTNGIMHGVNQTLDLAIGGTSTASAKFAVLNVNSGTPVASVSAGQNGAAFLTADGNLQTTAKQSLTLGGGNSGNIILSGFGQGIVHSDTTGKLSYSSVDLTSEVSNVLPAANGGTGQSSFSAGDLLYASDATTLSRLPIGTPGQFLTVSGGAPQWLSSSGVINFWQRGDGIVAPNVITDDLLLGATSTSSAKFAFINNAGGTPVASISGNIVLNSTGSLQATNNQ